MKYLLVLFLYLFTSSAQGALTCSSLLSTQATYFTIESKLEIAEAIESAIEAIVLVYQESPRNTDMISNVISELEAGLEYFLKDSPLKTEDSLANQYIELANELRSSPLSYLLSRVAKAESTVPVATPQSTNIFDSPEIFVAEKVYSIEIQGGLEVRFLFSKKIIDKVFNSSVISSSSVLKVLHQIRKGIVVGHLQPGIKRLRINKSVLELGAKGVQAGTLRIGGYEHDGVVHFVHYSNRGDHGSTNYIMRFRDAVLNQRQIRHQ